MDQQNIHQIQTHLAAFGRGDLELALSLVAEQTDWQSPASQSAHPELPWSGHRTTRAAVGEFFRALATAVQPERFELRDVTAQGDRVVVEGSNAGRVRATGRTYEHDWVMVFTLRAGEIVRHRHYYDVTDVLAAFR